MLKKFLIALLPLGTIAVVIWLVLPQYRALGAAREERGEVERALDEKRRLIAKIRNLETQYRQLTDAVRKVTSIVPPTPDIPYLLVEIPDMAVQAGMQLEDISFSAQEHQAAEARVPQGLSYRTMDVNMRIAGSYEALGIFLESLEKELRIMDIRSLQFTVPDTSTEGTGPTPFAFALSVRMYYGLEV